MTTHEIRKDLQMTQKEFAEEYNIPLGTIQNWDARDCMPSYIARLFAIIISQKKQIEILKSF